MSTTDVTGAARRTGWVPYAGLLVVFWGTWGAFSSLPSAWYDYPAGMIYIVWSFTMLIPALAALRRQRFDRSATGARYGLIIGLTGAGGQLVLFTALTMGPAYIIFPLIALSPAITVLMALAALRERLARQAWVGVVLALIAVVLFSISTDTTGEATGPYLLLAALVCLAWGAQAYFMRKAAVVGVNDATTFGWMTISGLLLVPFALLMLDGSPFGYGWQAPTLTALTQVLNAVGALFLVMAMSRGRASVVAPVTNALAPVLTVILSLAVFLTLPSVFQGAGIVLAIAGSTLIVRASEKRDEQAPAPAPARQPVADGGGGAPR